MKSLSIRTLTGRSEQTADPDQSAPKRAVRSESTLFALPAASLDALLLRKNKTFSFRSASESGPEMGLSFGL